MPPLEGSLRVGDKHHLRLNTQVGSGYWGEFVIDYMRAWRPQGQSCPLPPRLTGAQVQSHDPVYCYGLITRSSRDIAQAR